MATANPPTNTPAQSWTRSYPPLAVVLAAFLIAALVLPSALNMPQSNPTTVLEYAPVPPEDDDPPSPPDGNLSSLGLGSSGTLTAGGGTPPLPPLDNPDDFGGRGDNPKQFQCVGHREPDGQVIVRQTFDPMSPPCQPFFDGDNFGATYPGVTGDEINVVLYADVGAYGGEDSGSGGRYIDIDAKPKPVCPETWPSRNPNAQNCDNALVRAARALSRHFNARYQTYKRHVHFWIFISNAGTESARRAEAVKIWRERSPFAVIDMATFSGFNEAFQDSLASRGVLVYTSETALRGDFFRKNAPHAWGFWPDVEHWADLYSSFVCQKLGPVNGQPREVQWSGSPRGNQQNGYNGRPRKFGLWYTRNGGEPGLRLFAQEVKKRLEGCGIVDPVERTYANTGFVVDNNDRGTDQADAVVAYKSEGVTTLLWLGGIESKFTKAADGASYYPEMVIAGDLDLDGNGPGRLQEPAVWANAFGTSFQLRLDEESKRPGALAARDGDPNIDDNAAYFANDMYRDPFMLFQSIQVAGPRLTPESVDRGMHAIPKRPSGNPYKAAFFFDANDYSSVKDSMLVWWNASTQPPGSNTPGCYQMARGPDPEAEGGGYGHRVLAWNWNNLPDPFSDPGAPCTAHPGATRIRP